MFKKICVLVCVAVLASGAVCAADKELKVGFMYVSPIGDAGWSYAHDQGRLFLDSLPYVKTSFVEAVPEGADSERVMLNMARKGYDVVFATSFGYMDPMLKVAKQFPKTVFMHCSGFKQHTNMGNYFGRMYQARYLSGMVAGAMTQESHSGVCGGLSHPGSDPRHQRIHPGSPGRQPRRAGEGGMDQDVVRSRHREGSSQEPAGCGEPT